MNWSTPAGMRCPNAGLRRARFALLALCVASAAQNPAQNEAQSRPDSAPARVGKVIGQVLMPDGKPAPGASVRIFRPRVPSVPAPLSGILPEADHDEEHRITCDGSGNFSAPARPGEVHGLLAADGGELMSAFASGLCAGDSAVLRLGLTRVIEGTVVVAEEGKASVPAPGRRVCAQLQETSVQGWVRAPRARLETRSGPDGAWAIRVPVDATPTIRVVDEEQLGGRTLAIGGGDGGPIEITPRRLLRGLLVDKADGKPVAGAWVHWRSSVAGACVASDGAGRFALPVFASDRILHVIPRDHERTFWIASGEDEVKLELNPAGARMTGRLLREDGSPLGGARVIFSGPLVCESNGMSDLSWVHVLPADGRLELRCLQRGQVIMGFVEVDGTFVQFVADRTTTALAVGDLKVSVRGRIEGRVVAPDGSPLARAIVMAHPKLPPVDMELLRSVGANARVTIADRAGRFVLDGLAPGPHALGACAPGIVPAVLETTASAERKPVVLRLERGQTLSGRVVDEDGKPVAGVQVHLAFLSRVNLPGTEFGMTIPPAVTDAAGAFLFQGLGPKDRLWIRALPKRQGRASQPMEVTIGDDVELVLPAQK